MNSPGTEPTSSTLPAPCSAQLSQPQAAAVGKTEFPSLKLSGIIHSNHCLTHSHCSCCDHSSLLEFGNNLKEATCGVTSLSQPPGSFSETSEAQTSLAPWDRQLPVPSRPADPGSRRRSAPLRAAMGKRPLHPAAMFPAGPRAASASILPRPPPPPAVPPPRRLLGRLRAMRQRPVAAGAPQGRAHLALLGDLHRHDEPRPGGKEGARPAGGAISASRRNPLARCCTWGGEGGTMGDVVFASPPCWGGLSAVSAPKQRQSQ